MSERNLYALTDQQVKMMKLWAHHVKKIAEDPDYLAAAANLSNHLDHPLNINEETIEGMCQAYYDATGPHVHEFIQPRWTKLAATSPTVANAYRNAIRRAVDTLTQEHTA